MTDSRIRGRRIQFVGSADAGADCSLLAYAHNLLKRLTKQAFSKGAGLVVTVGSEPHHGSGLPLIFDWTQVATLLECQGSGLVNWPETQGAPVVAVGLPRWRQKIPEGRIPLWKRAIATGNVEVVQIRSGLSVGGVLRERQAAHGDILVALGGGPGTEHLAQLYMAEQKPVIPLDISLRTEKLGVAERLSTVAMETPQKFFRYNPPGEAVAAYSLLSLKDELPDIDKFCVRFFDFLSHLPLPRAFYVRLLNHKAPGFSDVESFFRNVVDSVITNSGYERFETGLDTSREPFLNLEIFKSLRYSSLVIADLTGLRPNCFMELGYALGLSKKVTMTAQEGTDLPFDSSAIPCHFWSTQLPDSERRRAFAEFMEKNINRRPLVS